MKGARKFTMLALLAVVVCGMPQMARAEAKVLNVIAVKVKPDQQDAYLAKVKKLNAMVKKEGGGTMRIWRAAVAGPNTGMIYVGIEYANLEAYAKATSKFQADDEWKKQIKDLDASGIREVVSTSLLTEITPE